MRKTVVIILCLALLLPLLVGCQEEKPVYTPTGDGLADGNSNRPAVTPPSGDSQPVSLLYDPAAGLNPYSCTQYTNRALFSLLYQGLFAVDRNYRVSPMLCESYNISADMKTYTFYISDALFSDGTAVTAGDVAASLTAAKDSAWYGGRLQHIASVSAYGDAVMVELDTAMEDLPILLDIPIVKASQVKAETPTGTGPYRLDGDRLRRVAGWWCSAELPVTGDTIPLIEAGTAAENRDSFEINGVTLVCTDPASVNYVDFHNDYELWEVENGLFLYLACNSESEVFSNTKVRAALTHAIDREKLVDDYYRNFARAAQLPCSPLSPHYEEELAVNYGYAPNRLKTVLEQEGLLGSEITLLLNGDDAVRVRVGNAIAGMLEEAGLVVTVEESTTADFADDLKDYKGEDAYDLYLAQTRLSANMDLSAFFGTDTALNFGGLTNAAIYDISLQALANAGNYYTLYEKVMDDGLLCPLLFQSYAVYTQRGALSGLTPARDNLFYYDLGRTMADALIRE